MFYTALDVLLRSVSICIIDENGVIKFEDKIVSEVEEVVSCLKRFSPEIRSVGFEAGALTQYLTYGLQAAGLKRVQKPGSPFCPTIACSELNQ